MQLCYNLQLSGGGPSQNLFYNEKIWTSVFQPPRITYAGRAWELVSSLNDVWAFYLLTLFLPLICFWYIIINSDKLK